jgi:leucyl aminopeptidase
MKTIEYVSVNSERYTELDKKLKGQLDRIGETEDNFVLSYPNIKDVDAISVFTPAEDVRGFARDAASSTKYDRVLFSVEEGLAGEVGAGIELGAYSFDKYKTSEQTVPYFTVNGNEEYASGIANSINFARDLVSEPANVLYPSSYANTINDMLSPLGVGVKIYHQSQLEEMGFNLLLSVGQGSACDSYVVVMEWMNGDNKVAPMAFVGKGVTFDTGGISIKPSAGMGDMKADMGGSAAVVGAMHAIATADVKRNVVGIVGLVENMPSSTAIKPGDIVTSMNGLTVENLNTDAEGRLVLADCLTYVQREYKPQTIVELSTLTGAILVALGEELAGLFTNSTDLANSVNSTSEAYWRMPMGKNWSKMIESNIADIKNIGGRFGGSTTAAEFLYKFIEDKDATAYAHLDIAGMANTSTAGATGFGVTTLFELASQGPKNHHTDEDMKY